MCRIFTILLIFVFLVSYLEVVSGHTSAGIVILTCLTGRIDIFGFGLYCCLSLDFDFWNAIQYSKNICYIVLHSTGLCFGMLTYTWYIASGFDRYTGHNRMVYGTVDLKTCTYRLRIMSRVMRKGWVLCGLQVQLPSLAILPPVHVLPKECGGTRKICYVEKLLHLRLGRGVL